jgi:hypothetical protein
LYHTAVWAECDPGVFNVVPKWQLANVSGLT